MEIQWEQLPERLQSKALECLLCACMNKHAEEGDLRAGFAHACVYMTRALTEENPEPFGENPVALKERLDVWLEIKPTTLDEVNVVDAFLEAHREYVMDRVSEVLKRATRCPDFKTKEVNEE